MTRICLFLLLLCCCSCGQEVSFLHPLPVSGAPLDSIPASLRGQYISQDRNSLLEVTPGFILHYFDYELLLRRDLPKGAIVLGDNIHYTANRMREKVFAHGDSIYRKLRWVDTLFSFGDGDLIKQQNNAYFLNLKTDGVWILKRLSQRGSLLTIGSITDSAAISALSNIAVTADSDRNRFDMNRQQFQEFMKNHPFISEDSFIRVRSADTTSAKP